MQTLQELSGAAGLLFGVCAVFLFVAWPALVLYALYSVTRSLRRIADATERQNNYLIDSPYGDVHEEASPPPKQQRGVQNSMFAR